MTAADAMGRTLERWSLADIVLAWQQDQMPEDALLLAVAAEDAPELAGLPWAVRLRAPATDAELVDIATYGWSTEIATQPVGVIAVTAIAGGPVTELRCWEEEEAAGLSLMLRAEPHDRRPSDPRQGRLFAA